MKPDLLKLICNALALAMGVAVIVLNIITPLTVTNATTLLAVGVAALGMAALQK